MSLTLQTVTTPRYANAAGTRIDCVIRWQEIAEDLPFTADQDDREAHGRAIFNAIKAGTFGPIAAYVPPPGPTQVELDETARKAALKTESQTDSFIEQLRLADPTQIKNWVTTNVTDLATARTTIGRLAVAVSYLLTRTG